MAEPKHGFLSAITIVTFTPLSTASHLKENALGSVHPSVTAEQHMIPV